jgi:sec-independent protein translocase protein TatA
VRVSTQFRLVHTVPVANLLTSGSIGAMEWIWVAAAALVVFGGAKLPSIARNLGRAQGELKKGLVEGNKEAADAAEAAKKSAEEAATKIVKGE